MAISTSVHGFTSTPPRTSLIVTLCFLVTLPLMGGCGRLWKGDHWLRPRCIGAFESLDALPLGAVVTVGGAPPNMFQAPTLDIAPHPFTSPTGTVLPGGAGRVENGGRAGGSKHELGVNNVVLSLNAGGGRSLAALRLAFGEYGGNLQLSINNTPIYVDNLSQLHGRTISGVTITVLSGGTGNDHGAIQFVGTMVDQNSGLGQFAIGGQELWIDDVCFLR